MARTAGGRRGSGTRGGDDALAQRTPLRIKLITALLALVALALTVISFTSV